MHVSQCASNLGTGRAQTGEIFLSCHIHAGLLSGHAEGVGEVAHLHPNGSQGPDGRARMGGRSCPTGHRSEVGQRKGVAGSPQDLRDREGGCHDSQRIIGRLGRNTRIFSAATGGIPLGPPVVCHSCWGDVSGRGISVRDSRPPQGS